MHDVIFQKTLYRQENNDWHYLRLVWHETTQSFAVCTAPCSQHASPIRSERLLSGETKETALHRLVVALRQVGYLERPTKAWYMDVQIFTPPWEGFTAAAPWFDALQFDILYPLYTVLEDTANGGSSGGRLTESGRCCYFLWVVAPVAAKEAVDNIARQAPNLFRVVSTIRKYGEKAVAQSVPDQAGKLSWVEEIGNGLVEKILINAEKMQYFQSLPRNQPIPDKTYPDGICGLYERTAPDRVRGKEAEQLREQVLTQWGVGKVSWPPLGKAAPCETLHVEELPAEQEAALIAIVQQRLIGQVYAFDASEGIFTSDVSRIFSIFQIDDTYWFDDGLEWMVFVSHENTVTFGGEWLLEEVRKVFRDNPTALNPWWQHQGA